LNIGALLFPLCNSLIIYPSLIINNDHECILTSPILQVLFKPLAKDMMRRLNSFFKSTVEVPRIKHGNRQTVETLINEEALLLAKYLRTEKQSWFPRIASLLA